MKTNDEYNGWVSECCRGHMVVIVGRGPSTLSCIRGACSDWGYADAIAALDEARAVCENEADGWCVSLHPGRVSPAELDRDPGVVAYECVETT